MAHFKECIKYHCKYSLMNQQKYESIEDGQEYNRKPEGKLWNFFPVVESSWIWSMTFTAPRVGKNNFPPTFIWTNLLYNVKSWDRSLALWPWSLSLCFPNHKVFRYILSYDLEFALCSATCILFKCVTFSFFPLLI